MRPLNQQLGVQEKTWIRRLALASAGVLFAAMQLNAQEPSSNDGPALNSPMTKKWTMVIRPGALDQNQNVVAPQLVEFEYDPANNRLVKAPEAYAIDESAGAGVAIKPAEMVDGTAVAATSNLVPPCPQPCPNACCTDKATASVDPHTMAELYDKMYDRVGFSRTEYLANPSYRNEAVIQMLLGKPIPKTINNTTINNDDAFGGLDYMGGIDGYQGYPGWNFPISTQSGTYLYPFHSPYYLTENYPNLMHRNVYSPWLSRYPFGNPGRYYYR